MRIKIFFVCFSIALFIAGLRCKQPVDAAQHRERPELQDLWLHTVKLDRAITIANSMNGEIIGTVQLLRPAPKAGIAVTVLMQNLSEAGVVAMANPSTFKIPFEQQSGTFRIRSYAPVGAASMPTHVTVRYGNESKTANFTIEALRINAMTIAPTPASGPFTASGTIALNALPDSNQTVTVTSSHPIVGFGSVGNPQNTASVNFTSNGTNPRTFQIVAGSVSQPTTVTITARMGQHTKTAQITVRP